MTDFEPLWHFVTHRTGQYGLPTIQDHAELEHVYNLMKECGCESYLEIGTAEGNSLYVLSHAVKDRGIVFCIDYGEEHTRTARCEVENEIHERINYAFLSGDSTLPASVRNASARQYDCVLIDGGHDSFTVLSDAINYGKLAKKYIFFHDIQLPEVKRAVEWFAARYFPGKYKTYINSETFGYGIIEVTK